MSENLPAWMERLLADIPHDPTFDRVVERCSVLFRCKAPEGFDVGIADIAQDVVVSFDGWHEQFDDRGEAADCARFGLSRRCRLKVVKRGRRACSWTVQAMRGDDWADVSTTGLLLVPFWRRPRVVSLHNVLLD